MLRKAVMALALVAVALSGCASDSGELSISYDEPSNPVTEAFVFKASGPGDVYRWNFGDGTPIVEGSEVEHLFGFTDGTIRVSLTGVFEDGRDSVGTSVDIVLGSGNNQLPVFDFRQSSEWLLPGESFTLSGLGTTDADGDPLLFRFECEARGAPKPPHDDGHSDAGTRGAVPFDVDAWATVDPSIPTGEAVSGDMCEAYNFDSGISYTTTGAITGSFTAPGSYQFNVEIRDPKTSQGWKARAQVFVTAERPPATPEFVVEGTLTLGIGGTQLEQVCSTAAELCGNTVEQTIRLDMPLKNATALLELDADGHSGTYTVARSSTILASGSDGEVGSFSVEKPTSLLLTATLDLGVTTDFKLTVTGDYDVNPYLAYTFP